MRYVLSTALLLATLLLFAACGGGSTNVDVPGNTVETGISSPFDKPAAEPAVRGVSSNGTSYDDPEADFQFSWELIAGQNMLAGVVNVWNDADTLYVEYVLDNPWMMNEAHLGVWTSAPGEKDGKPGQFAYKEEFDPAVSTWTFEVPLADYVGYKGQLYLATHAATNNGETIWGGNWNDGDPTYDFNWKKWGGGFVVDVLPMFEPAGHNFHGVFHPAGWTAYWKLWFTPDGDYPWPAWDGMGNPWEGWCTDPTVMYNNTTYNCTFYSCYDPNLPAYAVSDHWDLISWILNEHAKGPGGDYYYPWDVTQRAIHYFKYGDSGGMANGTISAGTNKSYNNSQAVRDLVQAAKDNGEGYVPGAGEYYAVIMWPGLKANGTTMYQMNIIAVDP